MILPIRIIFINAIIKTGKTLALRVERLSPLFRIARKSSCKFYTTIELAQALEQSTEIIIIIIIIIISKSYCNAKNYRYKLAYISGSYETHFCIEFYCGLSDI